MVNQLLRARVTPFDPERLIRNLPLVTSIGPRFALLGCLVVSASGCIVQFARAPSVASTQQRPKATYYHGQMGRPGETYDGTVLNGQPHGRGVYAWPSGHKYEGEFNFGKKHGRGAMTYPDGGVYEGEWKDDKREGIGTYTRADGLKYVGEWRNGEANGRGIYTSSDGWTLDVTCVDGQPHGTGTETTRDGQRQVGTWTKGARHGTFERKDDEGTFLTVTYDNGKYLESSGTWIRKDDGAKFEGEFRDGGKFGKGKISFADGRAYVGEWSDEDNKNEDAPNGQGTMTWPDGRVYDGAWNKGRMHGQGTLTRPDGEVVGGIWVEDELTSWSWVENPTWPKITSAARNAEQRKKWRADLRALWGGRSGRDPRALLPALLLRELVDDDERRDITREIREQFLAQKNLKVHVVFGAFESAAGSDPAVTVEIHEDTVRNIRQMFRNRLLVTDWDESEAARAQLGRVHAASNKPTPVDYLIMVKFAGIQLDEQRKVSTTAGKVEVDRKVYPNPAYYDLLKARAAAEGMLAQIQQGGVEAAASADEKTARATLPLLFAGITPGDIDPSAAGATLFGSLVGLSSAGADRTRASTYDAKFQEAQSVVNQMGQQLVQTPQTIEEPVYHEFRYQDQYVTKKAIATAFVKIVDPSSQQAIVFDRKIVADISKTDTYKEADKTTGREGDPLDLPSDLQMKREVARELTDQIVKQLQEGFLEKIGLERYVLAMTYRREGNAEAFAKNAVAFLLSPGAATHPSQAEEMILLMQDLVRRATGSDGPGDLDQVFTSGG